MRRRGQQRRCGVCVVVFWLVVKTFVLKEACMGALNPLNQLFPQHDPTPKVLACSVLATGIAAAHAWALGADDQPLNFRLDPLRAQLLCAYVGHYACCNGDTWCVRGMRDRCTHRRRERTCGNRTLQPFP